MRRSDETLNGANGSGAFLTKFELPRWFGVVAAAAAAILPILVWGIPASRDLNHHLRLAIRIFDSAQQWEFHPQWLSEANAGFGDLSLRFYPPVLPYSLAAARALFGSWYAALQVVFPLLTLASGLGAYF